MINTNPKKSQPIKKKIIDASRNVNIKKRTALIGFVEKSIKHADAIKIT